MHIRLLTLLTALTVPASATMEWFFHGSANPLPEAEAAAQPLILKVMSQATIRWDRLVRRRYKTLTVRYDPNVPTADGRFDDFRSGTIRFGPDQQYMTEHTALHEIAHTLGIGTTDQWKAQCAKNEWPRAHALLKQWFGESSPTIECGQEQLDGHFRPYGLNTDEGEWNEEGMERHVLIVDAMVQDMGFGTGEGRAWTA